MNTHSPMDDSGSTGFNDESLIAYAAGDLSPAESASVQAWLERNPNAAKTVAQYRLAQETFASDDSLVPTPNAITRAREVFIPNAKPTSTAKDRVLDAIDRIVARVLFDSRIQPLAVRSAGVAERISLTFETDDSEIDVQADRIPDPTSNPNSLGRWRIIGQLSGSLSTGRRAIALIMAGSEQAVAQVSADEHGVFTIDVHSGKFELRIDAGHGVVVLPHIELA
jgi:hypothetical protein